jgi:HK97 family phage major capsid protein
VGELERARRAYQQAQREVDRASARWDALGSSAPASIVESARVALDDAIYDAGEAEQAVERARRGHSTRIGVNEPDRYSEHNPSFLRDLYLCKLKNDPAATQRIMEHHTFEVESRSIATSNLGGIIPPSYLVSLYARAPRNGRVFIDQMNNDDPLPETGMSLIVPRLTQGTAAAAQASENSPVATQDPTEADLTVPVTTIAGYVPVSRQTLERAVYSEAILFEDLVARYYSSCDVDAINGGGSGGHSLGALQTAGASTSQAGSSTMASIWPKIADVIQQINSAVGGLGFYADKIFMHPRRWGFFEMQLDTTGRPVFGIYGQDNYAPSVVGDAAGYGPVGRIHGLPVFTDANIPTNFHTNQDAILINASRLVHHWERTEDPVTLSFEQQAGTSLQVQLVAYGYQAFTAGRYPAANGYVYGAGLVAPNYGS